MLPVFGYAQYSTYYNAYKVNSDDNIKVDQNINVSGNIDKTVTTIDYGALKLANAEAEKNRLENLKYADELEARQAIEIATNPIKAFDYGVDNEWLMNKNEASYYGFSAWTKWYHKIPHKSLFVETEGYKYRNESVDGVVTEIAIGEASYYMGTDAFEYSLKEQQDDIINNWGKYFGETEKYIKEKVLPVNKVGELINDKFLHKIDLNKATVYGKQGFVLTRSFEDDYEYIIKDDYFCLMPNGIEINASVTYKGDKDLVDFEMLEGRRAYLKRLCDQIIATTRITLGRKGLRKVKLR